MSWTDPILEAERQFTICNACRYCEGHCAVFPAMEMRRAFTNADLSYLANLCHDCQACYHHCQYAPPHEFAVNLPRVLSQLRTDTYVQCAWPRAFGKAFRNNGAVTALATALCLIIVLMATIALVDGGVLFAAHSGAGAFYTIIPHGVMAWSFGLAFGYAILAMVMGYRRFKALTGDDGTVTAGFGSATGDAATMRYMEGGGSAGCTYPGEAPSTLRRWFHHLTAYGFGLCFAATSVATIHHYVFDWIAPYSWLSLPVVLGTTGGIGLIIGPVGLLVLNHRARAAARAEAAAEGTAEEHGPDDPDRMALDTGFALLLLLTSVTGLALLVWRDSTAMGMLLAVHLGVVMALFVTLPYGKFIHGIYRFAALARYARENEVAGDAVQGAGNGGE